MDSSNSILGCYIFKSINLRRFKTENANKDQIEISDDISDQKVFEKLKSINPDIDLSTIADDVKNWDEELDKYNFQEIYDSPDLLCTSLVVPMYSPLIKNKNHKFNQTKKTKLYTSLPTFSPKAYHPFHEKKNQIPNETDIPCCKNTIQFYDTQTLQDLKQVFKCKNEESEISGDVSNNIHKPLEFIENSDLKHGSFYINNNIYVDSSLVSMEYTETMKKWACDHGHTIDNILSIDTQLLDLEVCIGQPYVYQHLGRCEHLFIFNEINIAKFNDWLIQSKYPRVVSVEKEKLQKCIFCRKTVATIVMLSENDRTLQTVNHMCKHCFESYNYDDFGNKISNFKC
eukprot:XP_016663495.1 PREDICTED: snRNA-activating protein complex subunit 3-like [Acyrthosiphon pisum]